MRQPSIRRRIHLRPAWDIFHFIDALIDIGGES
jgi:hypothetical protein